MNRIKRVLISKLVFCATDFNFNISDILCLWIVSFRSKIKTCLKVTSDDMLAFVCEAITQFIEIFRTAAMVAA